MKIKHTWTGQISTNCMIHRIYPSLILNKLNMDYHGKVLSITYHLTKSTYQQIKAYCVSNVVMSRMVEQCQIKVLTVVTSVQSHLLQHSSVSQCWRSHVVLCLIVSVDTDLCSPGPASHCSSHSPWSGESQDLGWCLAGSSHKQDTASGQESPRKRL